jgi:hypothetical protein
MSIVLVPGCIRAKRQPAWRAQLAIIRLFGPDEEVSGLAVTQLDPVLRASKDQDTHSRAAWSGPPLCAMTSKSPNGTMILGLRRDKLVAATLPGELSRFALVRAIIDVASSRMSLQTRRIVVGYQIPTSLTLVSRNSLASCVWMMIWLCVKHVGRYSYTMSLMSAGRSRKRNSAGAGGEEWFLFVEVISAIFGQCQVRGNSKAGYCDVCNEVKKVEVEDPVLSRLTCTH